MGTRARWARWVLMLVGLVVIVRIITSWMLPLLPTHVAWGSSIVLAAALTMFLVPLPQESTLKRPPRYGDSGRGDGRPPRMVDDA
jgi:hypothetical protein